MTPPLRTPLPTPPLHHSTHHGPHLAPLHRPHYAPHRGPLHGPHRAPHRSTHHGPHCAPHRGPLCTPQDPTADPIRNRRPSLSRLKPMQADMKARRGIRRAVDDIPSPTRESGEIRGEALGWRACVARLLCTRVDGALSEQNPRLAESMDDGVGRAWDFLPDSQCVSGQLRGIRGRGGRRVMKPGSLSDRGPGAGPVIRVANGSSEVQWH